MNRRCEAKRRKWRGRVFGTFACGRKARYVFQSYVGTTTTHYACGQDDCDARSIIGGYTIHNWREL